MWISCGANGFVVFPFNSAAKIKLTKGMKMYEGGIYLVVKRANNWQWKSNRIKPNQTKLNPTDPKRKRDSNERTSERMTTKMDSVGYVSYIFKINSNIKLNCNECIVLDTIEENKRSLYYILCVNWILDDRATYTIQLHRPTDGYPILITLRPKNH